jgi:hypothetical protein
MTNRKLHLACIAVSLLALGLPCALGAQSFTLAVIPDAQNYSDYRYQTTSNPPFFMDQAGIFYRQTEYVAANASSAGGDIAFAIFLGDLVNNYASRPSEWIVAEAAVSKLDGVLPFGIIPGNHDYDRTWKDPKDKKARIDGGKAFDAYFGPQSRHFAGRPWYGGSFDGGLDSWSTFDAGGRTFLFLGLELEASDAVIAWAQGILDAHPGMPTILATHEFLSSADEPREPGRAMRLKASYRAGLGNNSADELWSKLITKNEDIFLVLCGHHYNGAGQGEGMRVDADEAGFPVYQLLSDYQGRTELQRRHGIFRFPGRCGDGWMRLMTFDLGKREIRVRTYSTELGRYETDHDSEFAIELGKDWERRFRL